MGPGECGAPEFRGHVTHFNDTFSTCLNTRDGPYPKPANLTKLLHKCSAYQSFSSPRNFNANSRTHNLLPRSMNHYIWGVAPIYQKYLKRAKKSNPRIPAWIEYMIVISTILALQKNRITFFGSLQKLLNLHFRPALRIPSMTCST